jgi:hypothetical protein
MSCHYCQDLEKYSLLPATPCTIGQDAEGTNYWTSTKITLLIGQTFFGHKMKHPLLTYPNYNVICKDQPGYEELF